jgi:hypothetical protein
MQRRRARRLIGAALAFIVVWGWVMGNTYPPVAYGEAPTPTPTPLPTNDPGGSSGGGHY